MEYLFKDWEKVKQTLLGRKLFIFLDFDGTLTPIIENPKLVSLAPEARGLLQELSRTPGYRLAIVSGRGLKDIKNKIGLKTIAYAANFGLEIEGPARQELKFILPKGYLQEEAQIKSLLEKKLRSIPGVFIEDKGATLSLHYRGVETRKIPWVKKVFKQALKPFLKAKVQTRLGKKVLEVFPAVDWDKGKAVNWLLERVKTEGKNNYYPLYIGDDVSDESAFAALKNKGLTILVGGPKKSRARYYIRDTEETMGFLKKLLWETYARTE